MLHHSADVNARDKNWQTPLHVAAANNAIRCAEVIIPLLSSVNVSDRGGRTALHHAALNGHLEVLKMFFFSCLFYLFCPSMNSEMKHASALSVVVSLIVDEDAFYRLCITTSLFLLLQSLFLCQDRRPACAWSVYQFIIILLMHLQTGI